MDLILSAQTTIAIASCSGFPYSEISDAPLVWALERRGYHTKKAVWNDPAVGWETFDACVIRSTWDWHLQPARFRRWIADVAANTLLLNPPDLAIWGLDKRYLIELGRAGVPVVPTVVVSPRERVAIPDIARLHNWSQVVVKPAQGASSYRTAMIDIDGPDPHAWAKANLDWDGLALIQPFLPSIRHRGEKSVIWIGGEPTHAVRKLPKAGDFRVQGELGGTARLDDVAADEREIVRRCMEALPTPAAYARVDLVRGPSDELLVIECEVVEPTLYLEFNPRAAEALAAQIVNACSKGQSTPSIRGAKSP